MRILFLLDKICTGGAERNTINLAGALRQYRVEAELWLYRGDSGGAFAADLAGAGLRVRSLGGERLYDPRVGLRFLSMLRREKFDLIHLEDPYPAPLAALARHVLGIPVVVTRHVLGAGGATRWSRLRARLLNLATRLAADRAIVLASSLRHDFADQTGIGLERMSVVPNGIRTWPDQRKQRENIRRQLGWASEQRVVLIVAVLRGEKGHEDLFAALPQIRASVPQACVKVVGDGPQRAELETLARPMGDAIEFLGQCSDIASLMATSDVLALPSLSEAYPTVLLEAAMAALPAVVTDVGGSGEIVVDGVTGVLVQPRSPVALAEALSGILSDREHAAKLGAAARARALDHFTIERQAEATMQVYREILEGPHVNGLIAHTAIARCKAD
jgi:glycosyltransferase involved in cell wall biosynthesis